MNASVPIRPAVPADFPAIWAIFRPIVTEAETWAMDRDLGEAQARDYWFAPGHSVFVAELEGRIAGAYFLRRNAGGGGAHVANAGYIVDAAARGRGLARAMGEHSLGKARELGFTALQYNYVVSSNEPAVAIWKKIGMREIGRIPGGFIHPGLGPVDVLIMFREL